MCKKQMFAIVFGMLLLFMILPSAHSQQMYASEHSQYMHATLPVTNLYKFVDLSPYVNINAISEAGFYYGYSNLPLDTVLYSKFTGVPFVVRQNNGNILITLRGYYLYYELPQSIDISINDRASKVHFFGHAASGVNFDAIHGSYVIHYANGTTFEIPLDSRSSKRTWNLDDQSCNWRLESLPAAVVAWIDETQWPSSDMPWPLTECYQRVALFREYTWTNPKPELMIKHISFISFDNGTYNGDGVSPLLFAITLEK